MRFIRVQSFSSQGAAIQTKAQILTIGGLSSLLRSNGLFAVSEISKAIVIVGFGDFATADAVGEFISSIIPSAAPLLLAYKISS